jgi:hypothetical protein
VRVNPRTSHVDCDITIMYPPKERQIVQMQLKLEGPHTACVNAKRTKVETPGIMQSGPNPTNRPLLVELTRKCAPSMRTLAHVVERDAKVVFIWPFSVLV